MNAPPLPMRALRQLCVYRAERYRENWPTEPSALWSAAAQRCSDEELAAVATSTHRPYGALHRELLCALLGPPTLDVALGLADQREIYRAALSYDASIDVNTPHPDLVASLRRRARAPLLRQLGFAADPAALEVAMRLQLSRQKASDERDREARRLAATICAAISARVGQEIVHHGAHSSDKGQIAQAFERRIASWIDLPAARGSEPDFGAVEFKAVPLFANQGAKSARPADAKIKLCGIRVEPSHKLRHVVWGFYWKESEQIAGAIATHWSDAAVDELLTDDGIVEAPAGASGAGQRGLYLRSRVLTERGLVAEAVSTGF